MQQPGLPAGFQVEGKLFPPRLLPSGSLQAGMLPALTLSVCSCLVPIRAGCSGFDPDGFCYFTVKMYLLVRNATRNWRGFSSFLINGEVFHPNGRAVRNDKVCSDELGWSCPVHRAQQQIAPGFTCRDKNRAIEEDAILRAAGTSTAGGGEAAWEAVSLKAGDVLSFPRGAVCSGGLPAAAGTRGSVLSFPVFYMKCSRRARSVWKLSGGELPLRKAGFE